MPVDPEQHAQLARTARDVQAIMTAHAHDLDGVADDIVEDHLDGEDAGLALVTLLTMEAGHYLVLYAEARGVSVEEVLTERGRQMATL